MTPSPISRLDSIDVVGVRKDGGLDLAISCASAIDSSPETLKVVETKFRNYLREILHAREPTLLESYGRKPGSAVTIIVSCPYTIEPAAMSLLNTLESEAKSVGVGFILTRDRQDANSAQATEC